MHKARTPLALSKLAALINTMRYKDSLFIWVKKLRGSCEASNAAGINNSFALIFYYIWYNT